ncbi:alpha-(1,3)-fucosyltransferase B isoform X2 [Aethina tumida]|nr:alpha-(1,3)-fucosyltransferase B isoform X2 [Aethina tumida]XP_049826115.1 alpha-(1,3)-fucosyltransferase B isoform X2 [Aethina tumida]
MDNNVFPLPRNEEIWTLFHEESPRNYAPILYSETQNLFNITATFSRNSDFPLTLQYLPNVTILTDAQYFVNTNTKNKLLADLAPILYLQSDCDTPIGRDNVVKQLMKHIDIDSYGACLHNKDFPSEISKVNSLDLYNEELLKFIARYKFVIAFENAECKDYITEKLWRPLIAGSVPIYWGSPTVEDWLPTNNSVILLNNFESIESLAAYIKQVNNNDTLYNLFLTHKLQNTVQNINLKAHLGDADEYNSIADFECFICKRIHNGFNQTPKERVYDCLPPRDPSWNGHWNVGKCQAKALIHLIKANRKFSNETYEKLWHNFYETDNC